MTTATVATPAELLDTPDAFRDWLDQHAATAVVGEPESLFGCPIARYLQDQGIEDPAVGDVRLRWGDGPPRERPAYDLPLWAHQFVSMIDRSPFPSGITASYARALLHEVGRNVEAAA